MAFVPWKDRVTATPHRYKLTEVAPDTYDLEAVPGAISEAGTLVNAENLDRLIQRDGDDIKDTVTTFTEASTRANIATGESTATLFGKIKKYLTDLKTHAFTAPSTTQGTGTTTVPCDKLLKESSFARVYRTLAELGLNADFTIDQLVAAMADNSIAVLDVNYTTNTGLNLPSETILFSLFARRMASNNRVQIDLSGKTSNSTILNIYSGTYRTADTSNKFTGWKQIIDDSSAQTISAIKTFSVSPLVPTTPSGPSAAVAKAYADSLRTVYDKVIRTPAEFETLIADATWLGANSVALVGQFTLSTANNSGIKIPATVKQIHGFNGAKITITNFAHDLTTAKGGLWYATAPTTQDYSIRDLEVSCTGTETGTSGFGFVNCTNLTNCTGTGTGTSGFGFYNCTNVTNCTGTGTGTGTAGFGFRSCTNLTNCVGTGTGTGTGGEGYGFGYCTNVTNCTGTGTGTYGYGFYTITRASNCIDIVGSSTDMWGGTNKYIDLDTCVKTQSVPTDNSVLNT